MADNVVRPVFGKKVANTDLPADSPSMVQADKASAKTDPVKLSGEILEIAGRDLVF